MVSWWTWIHKFKRIFILARNYNGFVVDMDSLVQVNLHFSEELQQFGSGHGLDMASQGSIRVIKIRFLWIHDSFKLADSLPKRSQIGIRCSGTEKYSQRFEIGHFCPGTFSALQSSKIDTNPIGEPSVLPFQYPIYLWLQASAWQVIGIGGWCVPEYRFRNLWFKHRGIQLAL